MRDILFRGKRVDNGEWVHGFFWKDLWGDGESPYIFSNCEDYPVIPSSVSQYTGLKDKNGVEIFEGDIILVKNPNCYDANYEVFYDGSRFVTELVERNLDTILRYNSVEVIGNIYDSPELIKNKNKKIFEKA